MRYVATLVFSILFSVSSAQQLSKARLESIIQGGRDSHSDGVVIVKDNKVIVEEYYGNENNPTYIASVSKALTSMAIIKLMNDGKIKSIDQPVYEFYPEWKQGNKKLITLRMLLNHTSGMQNVERNASVELEPPPTWRSKNIIKLALAAELSDKPGTVFSYNNKATALLGGIIEVASGKRMDVYFQDEFFAPLGITEYDWIRDEAGNPTAHGAFRLKARDLAKFGQLMLNKGVYDGKRLFEEHWIDSSFAASSLNTEVGLLWWRRPVKMIYSFNDKEKIKALEASGIPDDMLTKFKTLYNRSFSYEDMITNYGYTFGTHWPKLFDSLSKKHTIDLRGLPTKTTSKEIAGYYHTGSWGNFLVLVPELNLVAVRVVKRDKDYKEGTDMFGQFVPMVFELAK